MYKRQPQRWLEIEDVLDWYEGLLAALPSDVAEQIRYGNAHRVIGTPFEGAGFRLQR